MSPKEVLYIDDALGHEQYLQTKCQQTANQLQDKELKTFIEQQMTKHRQLFGQFYQLV